MKNSTKSKMLKKYTAEQAKKILADLDDLIVQIQSAPISVIEKVIIVTRKILAKEC